MAEFNLSPNPYIVIVQAILFLICFRIIKYFFIIPYQKVQEKRKSLTYDLQHRATLLHEENVKIREHIDTQITQTLQQVQNIEKEMIQQAKQKQQELLNQLEEESKQLIEETQKQLEKELQQEKQKAKDHINILVDKIYEQIIN